MFDNARDEEYITRKLHQWILKVWKHFVIAGLFYKETALALFNIASALVEYCTLHSEHHQTSLTCLVPAAATDLWSSHSGATFHDKKH